MSVYTEIYLRMTPYIHRNYIHMTYVACFWPTIGLRTCPSLSLITGRCIELPSSSTTVSSLRFLKHVCDAQICSGAVLPCHLLTRPSQACISYCIWSTNLFKCGVILVDSNGRVLNTWADINRANDLPYRLGFSPQPQNNTLVSHSRINPAPWEYLIYTNPAQGFLFDRLQNTPKNPRISIPHPTNK
jgi:hypothetical protein